MFALIGRAVVYGLAIYGAAAIATQYTVTPKHPKRAEKVGG